MESYFFIALHKKDDTTSDFPTRRLIHIKNTTLKHVMQHLWTKNIVKRQKQESFYY